MLMRRKAIAKFEIYLNQRNLSQTYVSYIKIFFKYLNKNKLLLFDLTEEQLFTFLSRYKINTKNLFLKSLKKYFICFSIKTPLAIALLNKEISLIKTDITIKDYPNYEEVQKIFPYLKPKQRIIAEFLIATAIRKGEFDSLTRDNIDLARRIVKVYGKGRKERKVYITEQLANEMRNLFAQEPQQTNKNPFNFSLGNLNGLCRKLTQLTQARQKITPHSLRHIGALRLYHKGIDLVSLSRLLGHTDLKTSQIYINSGDEKVQEAFNAVMMKG